jgi:hypothetical protein
VPDFYVVPSTALGLPITADNADAAVDTAVAVRGLVPGGFWAAVLVERVDHFTVEIEQIQAPQYRTKKTRRGRLTPQEVEGPAPGGRPEPGRPT